MLWLEGDVMKLSGADLERLHQAICGAYDVPGLRKLLRFKLDIDLDEVAPATSNASVAVFDLLRYLEQAGRLVEFLEAARAGRPANAALRGVLDELEPKLRADAPGRGAGSSPVTLIDASLDSHDSPYEQVTEGGKKVIRPKPTVE